MIDAAQFVEAARARGFSRYAGVPCSYLTPFINYVIQDPSLDYVSAANEGDAVAISAGVALAGERAVTMMQNSGLGNAVSPLTSLTWTFALPQLLIITWRGEPGVADEPQHALMGPITPAMLDTMDVAWEIFPTRPEDIDAALERACAHMAGTGRPYALLMKKGSVAPFKLSGSGAPTPRAACVLESGAEAPRPGVASNARAARPNRTEALARVIAHTPLGDTVVLATTGFAGRELYALADRANQLYMVGSMGCVATLALGLARARPDLRVVAVDGDGAALMRMGLFATLGAYGPSNLLHLVLDNGVHDSTGGQATVSAGVSFARVAAACGYAWAAEGDALDVIDRLFAAPHARDDAAPDTASSPAGSPAETASSLSGGTRFACLRTRPGSPADLPRPSVTPVQVRQRLQAHIAR
ncbi:phosphonopyruvate decarboxylase [Robbsia sp. Bb-Pol-6]|uniref:Phosphonopyruvate decarboxylase n=1 Tax=Robbsia betulipollinis TaxID=2981849 RepID=A0ABT3ZN18_9BURK|nr:phosphonopyruvate decarboxylase [Robbsia betulipollinis]MCY0387941.1 phosphonopyruvate decarboxylase [Robbsia betulipollinis]